MKLTVAGAGRNLYMEGSGLVWYLFEWQEPNTADGPYECIGPYKIIVPIYIVLGSKRTPDVPYLAHSPQR